MQDIQQILDTLPAHFRGPGGAIAVLKEGRVVGQQVWGFANLEKRIPMTDETLMPICSISKQMVCSVLKDLEANPTSAMTEAGFSSDTFSTALRDLLPQEIGPGKAITIDHLCNNQSGIRDYWAMTLLWGANPEGRFTLASDARQAMQHMTSLHFQPGTQYAYANTNFHLLARAIEQVSGSRIGELLSERIFAPAGMLTATFCEDTAQHPAPCIGYEGDEARGYVPAHNRVEWSGDAGVVASLKDMIAYEIDLDRQWGNSKSVYRAIAKPTIFKDGSPTHYGHGLAHVEIGGVQAIGHAGALRGFRLQRLHAPEERLSVVVMFNHEADPVAAAEFVLRKSLNLREPITSTVEANTSWFGDFIDPVSQLAITVAPVGTGEIDISYVGYPERLNLKVPCRARAREMEAEISGDQLILRRFEDNQVIRALRLPSENRHPGSTDFQGHFHCVELDSTLHLQATGNVLFGAFDGFLGSGPAQPMRQLAGDIWILKCPRAMDAPAPGDWTLVFKRGADGQVAELTLGCWLARELKYTRVDGTD